MSRSLETQGLISIAAKIKVESMELETRMVYATTNVREFAEALLAKGTKLEHEFTKIVKAETPTSPVETARRATWLQHAEEHFRQIKETVALLRSLT